MNKMPRLSKSGIEYLTHTWGFYSGCHNWENGICPIENCWAKGITQRFSKNYPNGFEPAFYPEAFLSPLYLKKPSIIGCAFMGDLFGDWVNPLQLILYRTLPDAPVVLKDAIFTTIELCPQHKFLFLTKCPWNLIKWSPFPVNCWVGVTATSNLQFLIAIDHLSQIDAPIKFISFEPLLNGIGKDICLIKETIDGLIIGAQTNPYRPPKIEEVEEIVKAADKAGIPVFLKNNLVPMIASSPNPEKIKLYDAMGLRQEMPK